MQTTRVSARPLGSVPLLEVSGLASTSDRAGTVTIAAIGDREATIAWATTPGDPAQLEWQVLDLRHAQGTRIPQRDPQLEALTIDGAGRLLLVQEHPCRAEFIDARERRVLSHVELEVGPGAGQLHTSWQDPEGSHAEGVVLLRDGHLLVVKEKAPAALLEFGPAGDEPAGFGRDRWLGEQDAWELPAGEVTLTLLAAWLPDSDLRRACPDFSDAAVGMGGQLLMTGDQARVAIQVDAATPDAEEPFAGTFSAQAIWQLDGVEDKPEGVAVLPDGSVLIACDRRSVKKNLFLVEATAWQPA